MIVRHVTEGDVPLTVTVFEDRISSVGRSCFDDVRKRMGVSIARTADAAGIDDEPSVAKLHGARDMTMRAKDQRLLDPFGRAFDLLPRRQADGAVRLHGFQPIGLVIVRHRVTQEGATQVHACGWNRAQPFEMRGIELRMSGTIPRPHLLRRPVDQIAIVIAEHVNGIERHQGVHRTPRVERSAGHIAEVHDLIDILRADVRKHGLKCQIISVHVGNRRELHRPFPIPAACR